MVLAGSFHGKVDVVSFFLDELMLNADVSTQVNLWDNMDIIDICSCSAHPSTFCLKPFDWW